MKTIEQNSRPSIPWHVEGREIIDQNGDFILNIATGNREHDIARLDWICKACNMHQDFVQGLEAIKALALSGATHIHAIVDELLARARQ